jgi:hypothetical protein
MVPRTADLVIMRACAAGIGLALAGCSPFAPAPQPSRPNQTRPMTAPAPVPAPFPSPSPESARLPETGVPPSAPGDQPIMPGRQPNAASAVLLERGRNERAAGSYVQAAASIERALRIDPNNPVLWIELGEIKLAEGDRGQAEMMARKALTLAGNDRSIAIRAERLVGR